MPSIAIIVIGRNEGERLIRCFASIALISAGIEGYASNIVYVDSGSTDGSVEAAEKFGAHIVKLDMSTPFTAARARNAGVQKLKSTQTSFDFIQFIDGDCQLDPHWLDSAHAFLESNKTTAAVCGRCREEFPDHSFYNRLCDKEWDTPIGEALTCGGNAMFRADIFNQFGGFREDLIAGEEPELCLRLREDNWKIHRIDHEMVLHDANMKKFKQWWMRTKRCGFAYAQISTLHMQSTKRIWLKETIRALGWSALLPFSIIAGLLISPLAFMVLALYPIQFLKQFIQLRNTNPNDALKTAALQVIGKFAETQGIASYWLSKLRGTRTKIIEYRSE